MNSLDKPIEFQLSKKLRFIENLHIVFWLIKDMCWCLEFKILGIAMAIPTICIASYFVYKSKNDTTELFHNIAVLLWIIANTLWMTSEFFKFDETIIFFGLKGKTLCAFPFGLGIMILAIYYLLIYPKLISKTEL